MLASDWLDCFDEPITCCDSKVSWFDDEKETDIAIMEPLNENCHSDSASVALIEI